MRRDANKISRNVTPYSAHLRLITYYISQDTQINKKEHERRLKCETGQDWAELVQVNRNNKYELIMVFKSPILILSQCKKGLKLQTGCQLMLANVCGILYFSLKHCIKMSNEVGTTSNLSDAKERDLNFFYIFLYVYHCSLSFIQIYA